MKRIVLLALIIGGLVVAAGSAVKPAPRFTISNVDNRPVYLDSALTRGPVFISFWALWCKNCIKELDAMRPVYARYKAKGFTVLAVSEDGPKSIAQVKPFALSHRWEYQVLLDTEKRLRDLYQVKAMPTSFVIDRRGNIVFVHQNFRPGDENKIAEVLEGLFAQDGQQ